MEIRLRALFRNTVFLCCLPFIGGCPALVKQNTATDKSATAPALPFKTPAATVQELNPEIIFNALAGEISMQRGEYELAYQHQLQTAMLAGDAAAAERAAKIAVVLKRSDLALQAVKQWIKLDPNNLAGRQRAVIQYLEAGDKEQAFAQMEAILAISKASGENGYIPVMAVLSKWKDRGVAMELMPKRRSRQPLQERRRQRQASQKIPLYQAYKPLSSSVNLIPQIPILRSPTKP